MLRALHLISIHFTAFRYDGIDAGDGELAAFSVYAHAAVMLAEKQLTFNQLSGCPSANYAGYCTAGSLLFPLAFSSSPLVYAPCCCGFGGRHRYSYSVYGDIYSARGRHVGTLSRQASRGCGDDDFGSMIVLHRYRPSVCRRALSGVGAAGLH